MSTINSSISQTIQNLHPQSTQPASVTSQPNQTQPTQVNQSSMLVDGHVQGGSGTAASAPTDGAPGVTNPEKAPGYAKDPLAELQNDPDYKQLLEEIAFFESIQTGFYLIDQQFGGSFWMGLNDGKIDFGNILQASKDPSAPGYEAAKKLLARPDLRAKLDKDGDGLFTGAELSQVIDDLKKKKSDKEATARGPTVGNPPGSGSAPSPQPVQGTSAPGSSENSGQVGGTQGPPNATGTPPSETKELTGDQVRAEIARKTPRPEMTSGGGLEGASANMNATLGWMEQEFDRLTAMMGRTSDPAALKQLENECNKLSRQMQMVTSMMNQLMTMMSNISKMYADVAMNAIRNLK